MLGSAPVHDDFVLRDFTTTTENRLWLTDITEHGTDEGKLYLCPIRDVCSNRIVGYSTRGRLPSWPLQCSATQSLSAHPSARGCTQTEDPSSGLGSLSSS